MIQKHFDRQKALVTFTLPNSLWADQVHLVGDFNDWNVTSHKLKRDRHGQWCLTLELEPEQTYQFRYLCDNERWITEFPADGCVEAGDGIRNSLVCTTPSVQPPDKNSFR